MVQVVGPPPPPPPSPPLYLDYLTYLDTDGTQQFDGPGLRSHCFSDGLLEKHENLALHFVTPFLAGLVFIVYILAFTGGVLDTMVLHGDVAPSWTYFPFLSSREMQPVRAP